MNEETLILYYYEDELSEAQRAEVAATLKSDPSLRHRYDALCAELEAVRELPPIATPTDLVERLHDSIDRAAALERGRTTSP